MKKKESAGGAADPRTPRATILACIASAIKTAVVTVPLWRAMPHRLASWLPDRLRRKGCLMDPTTEFREAMQHVGLTPSKEIIADGELHRFPRNGKRGHLAGWYVLHPDGIPVGIFGCWRLGLRQNWGAKSERELTAAEKQQFRESIEAAHRKREPAERASVRRTDSRESRR
jgi:hypothetical protein